MPRETLGACWLAIEEAGDWDKLFWWDEDWWDEAKTQPATPYATKGDLPSVIAYLMDPEDPKIILIGEHDKQIAGITWFHERKFGTCQSGIWVAPKFRGILSRQLVEKSMDYLSTHHNIKQVFAVTPWVVCRNLCRKTGFIETSVETDAKGRALYHLTRELPHV